MLDRAYPALCLDILMVHDAGLRQSTVGDRVILVLCMVIIPLTHLGLSFPFRPSISDLDFITFPEEQDLGLGLHTSATWLIGSIQGLYYGMGSLRGF